MGRATKQWGRQPSGWWGLRAILGTGCVFYTIVMASGVGWLGSNVRRASRWPDAIHVHVPITIIFIKMATRDWVRKCLTICILDMIQWHLTLYKGFNLGNETSHLHTHMHKMSSELQPHGCFLFRSSVLTLYSNWMLFHLQWKYHILLQARKKCLLFAILFFLYNNYFNFNNNI